jgi:general secretion pathway protein G
MILHSQTRPERSERRSAFTLLEVLIVVAIIVILASIGGMYAFRAYEDAQINEAKIKAISISKAAEGFKLNNGNYPNELGELVHPPSGRPYLAQDELLDPWGHPYQFDAGGSHNNGLKADVFTTTPTGQVVGNFK